MRTTSDKQYVSELVDYVLTVRIDQRGHRVPLDNGVFVKLMNPYDQSHVDLYSQLSYGVDVRVPDDECLRMNVAGVGSIVHHEYHVDELELIKASLSFATDASGMRKLENVSRDLYYYVAFSSGMFWVRYDWIEIVRTPVG